MLTAITLQNFKGIGAESMRVPIKPLTILFGTNSIGKSTIVQAVH
jgi:predicted ATPase